MSTLTWETGETLGCTNCDTRYPMTLITENGVITEKPCPGCGRNDCTVCAD